MIRSERKTPAADLNTFVSLRYTHLFGANLF
jgi:hypothetical protein